MSTKARDEVITFSCTIDDPCDVITFSCTLQVRAFFNWLNVKKSTSSAMAGVEKGKRKRRPRE